MALSACSATRHAVQSRHLAIPTDVSQPIVEIDESQQNNTQEPAVEIESTAVVQTVFQRDKEARAVKGEAFTLEAQCQEQDRIILERDCRLEPDPPGVETGAGGNYICPEIYERSAACWVEALDLSSGIASLRCEESMRGVMRKVVRPQGWYRCFLQRLIQGYSG